MTKLKVAVIMGAESDLPVVKKAIETLDELGVDREVRVLSAHRTPEEACKFAAGAKEAGFGVLICAAGKAAHLAGVMAGHTTLPVIGIPVKGSFLDGLDALLATVQMPAGIPVATVAVDGAANAAILAAQMLALSDTGLANAAAQRLETVDPQIRQHLEYKAEKTLRRRRETLQREREAKTARRKPWAPPPTGK